MDNHIMIIITNEYERLLMLNSKEEKSPFKIGKISTNYLLSIIGVCGSTFRNNKDFYLSDINNRYAEIVPLEQRGKYEILRIYDEDKIYYNRETKADKRTEYLSKLLIDCIIKDSLNTLSNIASIIYNNTKTKNFTDGDKKTVERYLRDVRNSLFGNPRDRNGGSLGKCYYVMAKKYINNYSIDNENLAIESRYEPLSTEEHSEFCSAYEEYKVFKANENSNCSNYKAMIINLSYNFNCDWIVKATKFEFNDFNIFKYIKR